MNDEKFLFEQIGNNSKDPQNQNDKTAYGLFKEFSKLSDQASGDNVVNASLNLILNVIRGSCSTSGSAEEMCNMMNQRMKQELLDKHYYPGPAGKRKNIFPHTQILNVPHLDFREKKN